MKITRLTALHLEVALSQEEKKKKKLSFSLLRPNAEMRNAPPPSETCFI